MAVEITRLEHSMSELRDLAVKSRDAAQSRRLLAGTEDRYRFDG